MLCIYSFFYPIMVNKETMVDKARPKFMLFGGTFDPIHEGHVGLVRGLLARPDIQRVFVVPAGRNPFKGAAAPLPAGLRLEMATRALAHIPGATVLDLELRRNGPSYSIDTVATLTSQYPGADLTLAMGWDVYQSFFDWRNAADLLELAGLLVVLRQGNATPGSKVSAQWLHGLPPEWRTKLRMVRNGPARNGAARDKQGRTVVEFINLKLPRTSSSQIRRTRSLARVPAAARELLASHWALSGN